MANLPLFTPSREKKKKKNSMGDKFPQRGINRGLRLGEKKATKLGAGANPVGKAPKHRKRTSQKVPVLVTTATGKGGGVQGKEQNGG